jgi:hypothetical protein
VGLTLLDENALARSAAAKKAVILSERRGAKVVAARSRRTSNILLPHARPKG